MRDLRAPGETAARARAWAAVEAAHRAAPAPRRRSPVAVALAVLVALASGVAATTGSAVADWVHDVVDPPPAPRPAKLDALPGGGTLLVLAGGTAKIAGGKDLGAASEATWSAFGHYAALAHGDELRAVDLEGRRRWTLSPGAAVTEPRWSPDGFRVAYLAGGVLHVAAGDGIGDRAVGPAQRLAWGPGHTLAFARGREVRVIDTDARRPLFARRAPSRPTALAFGRGGLLVAGRRRAEVWAPRTGRVLGSLGPARDAAWAGDRVVLLRGSEVLIGGRRLFAAPGITAITPSPDGRWVLAEWQRTWLFLSTRGGRPRQVQNPVRRFGADDLRVAGWCCPKEPRRTSAP